MLYQGISFTIEIPIGRSIRPPSGANNHLVNLPADVAESIMLTLLGKCISFSFDKRKEMAHRGNRIGMIKSVKLVRRNEALEASGFLFTTPYAVSAMKEIQKRPDYFGTSYEIDEALVSNFQEATWQLTSGYFAGVAILPKKDAAYQRGFIRIGDTCNTLKSKLPLQLELWKSGGYPSQNTVQPSARKSLESWMHSAVKLKTGVLREFV